MILDGTLQIDKHTRFIKPHLSRITRNKHTRTIEEHRFNKECFKNSYFPRTIREWNKLPENVVKSKTVLDFGKCLPCNQ
ncbi:unnamed protein product [Ixodes pacificus]